MVTRNVTLKDFVDVEEKCSYHAHPDNSDWTLFRQETNITCASVPALKSMAEKIEQKCAEKFQQNSARGRDVVEFVCEALERAELSIAQGAGSNAPEPSELLVNSSTQQTRSSSKWRTFERAEFVGATL